MDDAAILVKPQHFFDPLNRKIFEIMLQMIGRRQPISPLTIHAAIKSDPDLIDSGGLEYLEALRDGAPSIPNVKSCSAILAEHAARRMLMEQGEAMIRAATMPPTDMPIFEVIAKSEVSLLAATKQMRDLVDPADINREGRLGLISFEKITLSRSRRDLVKDLVPRVGLTVIWGPPKCGKSFFVFDLMMHVALGWEYRGRRVHQGSVVYCAFEGQQGIEARIAAFRQTHLHGHTGPVPFYLQPVRMDLVRDYPAFVTMVRSRLAGELPAGVVLDTLNRSFNGSESSDEDMSAYVAAADAIREAFGCAVIIVHHCGIGGDRPRGHSSLSGAVEAQLAVRRDAADNIVVEVELAKDGPQGAQVVSSLDVVEVGRDEDGEAMTSCVIIASDSDTKPTGQKVTGTAELALRLLGKAIEEAGQTAPPTPHIPAGTRTVHPDVWRSYCYQGQISESDDPDARRKAFVRASKRLQVKNRVGVWGDHVWLK